MIITLIIMIIVRLSLHFHLLRLELLRHVGHLLLLRPAAPVANSSNSLP